MIGSNNKKGNCNELYEAILWQQYQKADELLAGGATLSAAYRLLLTGEEGYVAPSVGVTRDKRRRLSRFLTQHRVQEVRALFEAVVRCGVERIAFIRPTRFPKRRPLGGGQLRRAWAGIFARLTCSTSSRSTRISRGA